MENLTYIRTGLLDTHKSLYIPAEVSWCKVSEDHLSNLGESSLVEIAQNVLVFWE